LDSSQRLDFTVEKENAAVLNAAAALKVAFDSTSSVKQINSAGDKVKKCPGCGMENPRHSAARCYVTHPELKAEDEARKRGGATSSKVRFATTEYSPHAWMVTTVPPSTVKGHCAPCARRVVTLPGADHIIFDVDSGASEHYVNSPIGLDNFDAKSSIKVKLADDSSVRTTGIGSIGSKLKNIHVAPTRPPCSPFTVWSLRTTVSTSRPLAVGLPMRPTTW
jgi:hypothetical protein